MNKLIISLLAVLAIISCKPRSGPLATDNSNKSEMGKAVGQKDNKTAVKIEKMNVTVQPCEGCTTISDLFANKKSYTGKSIKITGKVTKYNPSIMGKNWIHIQDGSEYKGDFDLTITTDQQVSVGDIITYQGTIVLDKDFGYGYFYSVLMEEGRPAQ
jgi:hypothetical protein